MIDVKKRILYAEGDLGLRDTMTERLQRLGHEVVGAASAREAIEAAQHAPFDLVLTDQKMETDTAGIDLAKGVRAIDAGVPIIMMSGDCPQGYAALETEFKNAGGTALMDKVKLAHLSALKELLATHLARAKRPKVLLVDDMGVTLEANALVLKLRGFDVVQMHIGHQFRDEGSNAENIKHADSIDDVLRYALNPANRIDAVLTDLYDHGRPYGSDLAGLLKRSGFNGAVAVHTDDPNDSVDVALKEKGALGLFKNGDWDTISSALHGALKSAIKM